MKRLINILILILIILSISVCFFGCSILIPGTQGIPGENGADGITPQLRINSENCEWEVSYDNGLTWNSLGVTAMDKDSAAEWMAQNAYDDYMQIIQKPYCRFKMARCY